MVNGVVRLPLIVITRGSVDALPRPFAQMLSKNQKGLEVSIKSLQATRDGCFRRRCALARQASSALRFTLVGPARLSFWR